MISGIKYRRVGSYKKRNQTKKISMDYSRLYDMSDQHSDIGVTLWGPGQQLTFKASMVTSASTSATPSYSQTLDLENRMLDGHTMVVAQAPTIAPFHTTVISGTDTRHAVCPPAHIRMPAPVLAKASSSRSRTRGLTADPCQLAPLKKRRIQLELLNQDQRDRVVQKREKNKVAAEKCRVKRREKVQQIRAEYDEFLEANEELESKIRQLKEEYCTLQDILENHSCTMQKCSHP